MKKGDSTAAHVLGEKDNLVRIMTMHKSKGLEFPVVFLMRLSGKMQGRSDSNLQVHKDLGLLLPYLDRKRGIRSKTTFDTCFKFRRRLDEYAEICRLLYVAMTRAGQRLILTGCSMENDANWLLSPGDARVWKAGCMLDWIMQAVCDEMGDADFQSGKTSMPWYVIREKTTEQLEETAKARREDFDRYLTGVLSVQADPNAFPWWHEERSAAARQPLKTSVTSLVSHQVLHDPMPITEQEEEPEDKRKAEEIVSPLRLSELPARPAFLEEKKVTGAERGTVVHRLLSLLELPPLRGLSHGALLDEVTRQIASLAASGIINDQ